MEIEVKYAIPENVTEEQLLNAPELRAFFTSEPEIIRMDAVYYDTEDQALQRERVVLRIRDQNDEQMLSVKWKEAAEGALFRRGEENICVPEETRIRKPEDAGGAVSAGQFTTLLSGSEAEAVLEPLLKPGCRLVPLVETRFVRKKVNLNNGRVTAELALDSGEILAAGKAKPIRELEIELIQGSEEDLLAYGHEIARKYGLKPEQNSKFARGIELLSGKQDG